MHIMPRQIDSKWGRQIDINIWIGRHMCPQLEEIHNYGNKHTYKVRVWFSFHSLQGIHNIVMS